jgi:hypothetical protein
VNIRLLVTWAIVCLNVTILIFCPILLEWLEQIKYKGTHGIDEMRLQNFCRKTEGKIHSENKT